MRIVWFLMSLALLVNLSLAYNGPVSRSCATGQRLSFNRIKSIKKTLNKIIKDDKIAHVVRLSFHDCVDGCDGCINENNPSNKGPMLDTMAKLNKLYDDKNYSRFLTRADFFALSGLIAIENGIENANIGCQNNCLKMPYSLSTDSFLYCRRDCSTSPTTSELNNFPHGHFNNTQVMRFFRNEFGLNRRLATALLGAHTLGGAAGAIASGFQGFWKEDAIQAKKFDSRYYGFLVDSSVTWDHLDKSLENNFPQQRWQWDGFKMVDGKRTQVSFMLNADVALIKEITTEQNGKSDCEFNECRDAPTAYYVRLYASNPNLWLKDFAKAYNIMINNIKSGTLTVPSGTRDVTIGPDDQDLYL